MARGCHGKSKHLKVKDGKKTAKDRRTWRDLSEKEKTHRGFRICKSVHHHTFQINQPTRCSNFSSLLLVVLMFRASSCPSLEAQQLQ
jgi:hypothetical protein